MTDDERDRSAPPVPGDDVASAYVNALPPGTRLFEFELLRPLGEGGFGVVYLAFDHSLHRNVAIKEYLPSAYAVRRSNHTIAARSGQHQATFEAGLKSFIKEARLLAQFDHPALVKVHRFWEGNGTAYMAMSYYPGQTLADILRSDRSFASEPRLKALIAPLLDAVSQLHDQQCFHRDISPENIIVQPNGAPVLLDFGAARRIIGDMTQALTVVLKPGYAPIEQYVEDGGLVQGPWTDVYGFAALLYCAVVGKPPPAAVTRAYKDALVPLASNPPPGYDLQFLGGIDEGLKVKPEDRPATLAAFRDLLGIAGSVDMQQQTVIIPRAAATPGAATGPRSMPGPVPSERPLGPAVSSTGAGALAAGATAAIPPPPPAIVAPSSPAIPVRPKPAREAPASRGGLIWGGVVVVAAGLAGIGWWLGLFGPAAAPGAKDTAVVARGERASEGVAPGAGTPAVNPMPPAAAGAPSTVEPASVPPAAPLGASPAATPSAESVPPAAVAPPVPKPAPPLAKGPSPRDARSAVEPTPDRAAKDKTAKEREKDKVAPSPARETPARAVPGDERRLPNEQRPADKATTPERPTAAPEKTVPPADAPRMAKAEERTPEVTLPRDLSDEGRRLYVSANAGNAGAQNALANMYYSGRGATQSDIEAVRWWTKAAEQGNLNAQNNLGFMYFSGRGVAKDQAEGARWWQRAAEHGFAAAQNNLAGAYRNGFGVPKNEQEAFKWYRRSAEQGHAGSQKAVGDMYYFGLGVPKEEAEAIAWYRRAADNGNLQAADQLKAIESLRAK